MFEDWKRIYQNRFNPASYDLRTAELWALVMKANDMTMSQFQTAYKKSLVPSEVGQNGFPPSSVEDFMNLSASYEYLDTETAFKHACSQSGTFAELRKWSDCVVYETANRCGIDTLANCTQGYIKRFKAVYEQVIVEHKAGKTWEIPTPRAELEHKHVPADKDFVMDLLGKTKKKLRGAA